MRQDGGERRRGERRRRFFQRGDRAGRAVQELVGNARQRVVETRGVADLMHKPDPQGVRGLTHDPEPD